MGRKAKYTDDLKPIKGKGRKAKKQKDPTFPPTLGKLHTTIRNTYICYPSFSIIKLIKMCFSHTLFVNQCFTKIGLIWLIKKKSSHPNLFEQVVN